MFTKTRLIKWTIALALLAVAAVTGLALAAGNDDQPTLIEAEPATVTEKEMAPASLLEVIPAENLSDYWRAEANSNGQAFDTEAKLAPASLLEVIPAESLPDYWRAEANSNGQAFDMEVKLAPASLLEVIPAENLPDYWQAEANSNGQALDAESERPHPQRTHLKFDVAEDMTRFAFDESKTFEDGLPAHGSSFITQGYIYEYGTLSDSNGVLPDGSPEFPDKVIGSWVCRGWFVGDAAHATEGVWVVTTQILNFGEEYGRTTIITEGYESAVFGESLARAITGGTGEYVGAKGEANQVLLGFNEGTEGVNLRFELDVTR